MCSHGALRCLLARMPFIAFTVRTIVPRNSDFPSSRPSTTPETPLQVGSSG